MGKKDCLQRNLNRIEEYKLDCKCNGCGRKINSKPKKSFQTKNYTFPQMGFFRKRILNQELHDHMTTSFLNNGVLKFIENME